MGVTADGQKYAHSLYFNIKLFRVLEIVRYIRRKEDCHKAVNSTVGEEHKKCKCKKKKPFSPQVHTADIPRDLRTHMDKSA